MVDFAKSRATAQRLIEKFGGEAFLVTSQTTGGTVLNPGSETPGETPVFAVVVDYTVHERSADGIQVGDRRAIISAADGAPEPDTTAVLRFKDDQNNNTDLSIQRVSPLQPGGPNDVAIFYDCQVRG